MWLTERDSERKMERDRARRGDVIEKTVGQDGWREKGGARGKRDQTVCLFVDLLSLGVS